MRIKNALTTFGLMAALAAGEAAEDRPRITPAVMFSRPGVSESASVQNVVARKRRRRKRVVRTRSKRKSAAIVGGSAAAGAAVGAAAGGGKGAAIGAATGGTAGAVYDRKTRKKTVPR